MSLAGAAEPPRRRWRATVTAVTAVGLAAALAVSAPVAQAQPVASLQMIDVRQVRDGAIIQITDTTAVRNDDGTVDKVVDSVDPAAAADRLPIRAQTQYWLAATDGQPDRAGTNLADIAGRSGRVTIRVQVDNQTVVARRIAYTVDGSQYERYAMVGVPLTVVASATLPAQRGMTVVGAGQVAPGTGTDGVVTTSGRGGPFVQWAAMLAPPYLTPTATFTLVEETNAFAAPSFDLVVQPGWVTDPSLQTLLATSLGSSGQAASLERATIELILGVNQQIGQVQDYVAQVHQALSVDAQVIGTTAYQELQASSTMMLSQIDASQSTITALQQQASSQVESANSRVSAGLSQVLTQISTALGSSGTVPPVTQTVINGCSITLPTLAPNTPRTLAAAIHLVRLQLEAVASAFDVPDAQHPLAGPCRQRMIDQFESAIGTPGQTCPDDPNTPQIEPVTVQCAITAARDQIYNRVQALQALDSQMAALLTNAGVGDLRAQVDKLRELWDDHVYLPLLNVQAAIAGGIAQLDTAVAALTPDLNDARTALAAIDSPGANDDLIDTLVAGITKAQAAQTAYKNILAQINQRATAALATPVPSVPAAPTPVSVNTLIGVSQIVNSFGYFDIDPGGLVDLVGTLVRANLPICHVPGPPGTPDFETAQFTTIGDIVAAFTRLATRPGACPAQPLASQWASVIQSYDQAVASATTWQTDDAAVRAADAVARSALSDIADLSDSLVNPALGQADIDLTDALTSLTTTATDLRTKAGDANNAVARIQTGLAAVTTLAHSGALAQAKTDLDDLISTTLPLLRDPAPGHLLLGDTPCPTNWGQGPTNLAPTPLDAVIQLTDRLTCLDGTVVTTVNAWFAVAENELRAGADQLKTDASTAAQLALDLVKAEVTGMSAGLASTLHGVAQTVGQDLTLLDASQAQTQATVATTLSDLTTSSQQSVAQLASQIAQATVDSQSSKTLLQADFALVLASLGSTDPTSRVGLLGKLRSATGQIGSVADALSKVEQTTTTSLNTRQAEARVFQLNDAIYKAVQAMLDAYQPFPGPRVSDTTVTVFTFHLGNN